MATVTPKRSDRDLSQDQVMIRSPLAKLRKYIYSYVSLEGAAQAGLFLALWFWIGLIIDYGFFKLFLLDWVQELPWGFRAGVLVVLLGALLALLATTILVRLFRSFSDDTMALLLEKRFPSVLSDRLITAVELSDPQAAAEYGYSPAMVRQTIHEAADRVGELPLGQVFDWKRLTRRAIVLGILTIGLYLGVAGGFCAARSIAGEGSPMLGIDDFNEVATIWTERNVLLRNTIWPRRSYLEILPWETGDLGEGGVGDNNELRIPQGTAPPALRVRAWKYIVADPTTEEGWRRLTWSDLKKTAEYTAKATIPELPAGWKAANGSDEMTVDEVELRLEGSPIKLASKEDNLETKWNFVSNLEESGYRPLMWSDLTRERLAGLDVPGIPGSWDPKAIPAMIAGGAGLIGGGGALDAASRMLVGPKFISLTMDEVEGQLKKAEEKDAKNPAVKAIRGVFERLEQMAAIQAVFAKIDDVAARRDMRRVMRKLIVPQTVTLVYSNKRNTTTSTMARIADNQYTGSFAELKEPVNFTVRGEDYVTPRRYINVVERPRVDSLESDEERPAYLYYRPYEDPRNPTDNITAADLRGKRQVIEQVKLSVSGESSNSEVPMGTTVTLTGTVTKPIRSVSVSVDAKDKKTFKADDIEGPIDGKGFKIRIPDVRRDQKFKVVFTDTDGIVGERRVVIVPKEDVSPRVREFNPDEVIRRGRGAEGFIVAVGCRIPFKGRVLDDHGLSKVRYACRVIPADFISAQKVRTMLGVGALPLFQTPGTILQATGYMMALTKEIAQVAAQESGGEQYIDLKEFNDYLTTSKTSDGREEFLKKGTVMNLLQTKQREPYRKLFREFIVTPDRWSERFAERQEDEDNALRWIRANESGSGGRAPLGCDLLLSELRWRDKDGKMQAMKNPDPTRAQRRFLIEVRLMIEDTYLEGELDPKTKQPIPHISPSGETFTFVVVPENELLSRIAEEEETKYRELQKAFKPLPENLDRMREAHFTLSDEKSVTDTLAKSIVARCDTLTDVLKTSHQDTKGVYTTYERILREMRVNQVREDIMTKVYRTIYKPLQFVSETQFDRTYNMIIALRRTLDDSAVPLAERVKNAKPLADAARKNLNELVSQMNSILAAMEGLSKINELIQELARIEKQEEDLENLVNRILKRRVQEILMDD